MAFDRFGYEITICSVYHSPESKKLLEINADFVKKMNPGVSWRWLAVDNSLSGLAIDVESGIETMRGTPFSELPLSVYADARPSYHHSLAINKLLPLVGTRFVLSLDSDFYIVRKNWIREALEYMRSREIAFLGAPWHPRWWKKIRYFPAHHSLFIDLDKIDIVSLDFTPQYNENTPPPRTWKFDLLPIFARKFAKNLLGRFKIGSSKDTGYAIYDLYNGRKDIANECFIPVFRLGRTRGFMHVIKMLASFALPDRWSYVPKRKGYHTEIGFKELGCPDVSEWGWEEFMWFGRPLGFHLRGNRKDTRLTFADKLKKLDLVLKYFHNPNI